MKACFKCNEIKPLSEYYAHKQMGDGHLGKCKDCTKRDVAKRIAKKTADFEWATKELERHRIKARKYRAEGKFPDANAQKRGASKWAKANKIKRNAHCVVQKAIKQGLLNRLPCQICNEVPAQAHHEDYLKPLDVQWLCVKHHNERHVELRQIARFAKSLVK